MIKLSIAAFMLFLLAMVPADLKKLREHYVLMSSKESSALLVKELAAQSSMLPKALKDAYFAAAEMALAQYRFSPVAKLNAFNGGKKLLEAAVRLDSTSIEVRYIRFTIQCNAPGFLGYTKSIPTDKNFLVRNIRTVKTSDPELFSGVCAYLLSSGKLSNEDKALLNK